VPPCPACFYAARGASAKSNLPRRLARRLAHASRVSIRNPPRSPQRIRTQARRPEVNAPNTAHPRFPAVASEKLEYERCLDVSPTWSQTRCFSKRGGKDESRCSTHRGMSRRILGMRRRAVKGLTMAPKRVGVRRRQTPRNCGDRAAQKTKRYVSQHAIKPRPESVIQQRK